VKKRGSRPKQTVTFRISSALKKLMEEEADLRDMTTTGWLVWAIGEGLKESKAHRAMIEEVKNLPF